MLHVAIQKRFPHFALNVDFAAAKGITGVIGPSGCGKSLTLQCIAGLQSPDEGTIALNGRVFFDAKQRVNVKTRERKIGYMFQHYALFPHLTVKQNVAFGLKGRPKAEVAQKTAEMLEKIGMKAHGDRYPSQLSGGQQQRVALARTLITKPDLLLLDEPFAAVDPYLKRSLEREFRSFLEEQFDGIALLVTHNMEEAERLCDQLLIYHDGNIAQLGRKEDVLARPANVHAARIIGYENMFPVASVEERPDGVLALVNGAPLVVEQPTPSLSARFLGIYAEHVQFVQDDRPNAFAYEIVQMRARSNDVQLTAKTAHFVVQATVSKQEWGALVQPGMKLHLPPKHLFFWDVLF
jgi:molybdate transport system ATP-binding protein